MHSLSEIGFYLHEDEKSSPYQRLRTSRFDTEARGNSDMAHLALPPTSTVARSASGISLVLYGTPSDLI